VCTAVVGHNYHTIDTDCVRSVCVGVKLLQALMRRNRLFLPILVGITAAMLELFGDFMLYSRSFGSNINDNTAVLCVRACWYVCV